MCWDYIPIYFFMIQALKYLSINFKFSIMHSITLVIIIPIVIQSLLFSSHLMIITFQKVNFILAISQTKYTYSLPQTWYCSVVLQ